MPWTLHTQPPVLQTGDLVRVVSESQRSQARSRVSHVPEAHRKVLGFEKKVGEGHDGIIHARVWPWRPQWLHPSSLTSE
jgi:hypothetical protein